MTLAIGSDHAGFKLRKLVADFARGQGHEVLELGAPDETAYDYPAAADQVACALLGGKAELGVLICGSGIGVSIRANRYRGIRAAPCTSPELAALAREHNHANVLCMGQRVTESGTAIAILEAFIATGWSQEERHGRRVNALDSPAECQ